MSFMKSFITSMVFSSLMGSTFLAYAMEAESTTSPNVKLASTLVKLDFHLQGIGGSERMTLEENDQFLKKLSQEGITDVVSFGVDRDNTKLVSLYGKRIDFERVLFPILGALKNHTTLTVLNLGVCRDYRLWGYVTDILKTNTNLKSLNLQGIDICVSPKSDELPLVEMISFEGQINLTTLNLSALWLDLNTFKPILRSIQKNCLNLTDLDISNAWTLHIEDVEENKDALDKRYKDETTEILQSLPASLQSLRMEMSGLRDASMFAFTSWLSANTKLTHLNLRNNEFGDLGANQLSKGLSTNTTLTHLNVSANYIQLNGIYDISGRVSAQLVTLDFRNNTFVADTVACNYLSEWKKFNQKVNVICSTGAGRNPKNGLFELENYWKG